MDAKISSSAIKGKGTIVISETMLIAFSVIITLILVASFGMTFLSSQAEGAKESPLLTVARNIAIMIDRAGAEAGSVALPYEAEKGLSFNVKIGYRRVVLKKDEALGEASFTASRNAPEISFDVSSPVKLCIVKNQIDNVITVGKGDCDCVPNNGVCNPGCIIENGDPDCNEEEADGVCDYRISKPNDGICDPDCYKNITDRVDETADCNPDYDVRKGVKFAEADGICDKDSNGIGNGICDLDCINNVEDGFYDPDCTIEDDKDGYCDPDSTKDLDGDGKAEIEDDICDLDCAENEEICDPDCGASGDPACGMCALEGENASEKGGKCCTIDEGSPIPLVECPGDNICRDASKELACAGNGICEASPLADIQSTLVKKWPLNSHAKYWENELRTKDCMNLEDGLCWPTRNSQNERRNDPDCLGGGNKCGYGWNSIMDDDPDCDGASNTEPDGVCLPIEDGRCDRDCSDNTEVVDPDCSASENPAVDCSKRVDKGNYKDAPACGYDANNDPQCPVPGVIQVCNTNLIDYLDRRSWDINQIAKEIVSPVPRGWAFDDTRYDPTDAQTCSCTIQKASVTVNANEDYLKDWEMCCPLGSNDGCTQPTHRTPECEGVGFCGDHSVGLMSILRTLGVPSTRVFSVFSVSDTVHHGWVAYKCDRASKERVPDNRYGEVDLKDRWCNGDEWLTLDATSHNIMKMKDATIINRGDLCRSMKIWFNDHGLYEENFNVTCGSDVVSGRCRISASSIVCENLDDYEGQQCILIYPGRTDQTRTVTGGRITDFTKYEMPVDPQSYCS